MCRFNVSYEMKYNFERKLRAGEKYHMKNMYNHTKINNNHMKFMLTGGNPGDNISHINHHTKNIKIHMKANSLRKEESEQLALSEIGFDSRAESGFKICEALPG